MEVFCYICGIILYTIVKEMGKILRFCALCGAMMLMVASCVKSPNTEILLNAETAEDLANTFSVAVDDVAGLYLEGSAQDGAESRAMAAAEDEDLTIYNLWVLQVDPAIGAADDYGVVIAARYIDKYNEDGTNRSVQLYEYTYQPCHIVYVANTNSESLYERGQTLKSVYETTYEASSEAALFANKSMTAPQFVMSAQKRGVNISADSDNIVAMAARLTRNIAKIEYVVNIKNTDAGLSWKSAQLCNVPKVNSYTARLFASEDTDDLGKDNAIHHPTIYDKFPASVAGKLMDYPVEYFESADDATNVTFHYYVATNKRGFATEAQISDLVGGSSYGYAGWAAKMQLASTDSEFQYATYFKLIGRLDNAKNLADGDEYDVVFTDYLGKDEYSYNIEPNHLYEFSLNTNNVTAAVLANDARFELTEIIEQTEYTLPRNFIIGGRKVYTFDATSNAAPVITQENNLSVAISNSEYFESLYTFYISNDGDVLGYAGNMALTIELMSGADAGAYLYYIANVPNMYVSTLASAKTVADIDKIAMAMSSSNSYSPLNGTFEVMTAKYTVRLNATTDIASTTPTFGRNFATITYTFKNTDSSSVSHVWSKFQMKNLPTSSFLSANEQVTDEVTSYPTNPLRGNIAEYSVMQTDTASINSSSGLIFTYDVPVNIQTLSGSESYQSWGAKYVAAMADESVKACATYMEAEFDLLDNGTLYSMVYANFLGKSMNDFRLEPNVCYAFNHVTTGSNNFDWYDADSRYDIEKIEFSVTSDLSAATIPAEGATVKLTVDTNAGSWSVGEPENCEVSTSGTTVTVTVSENEDSSARTVSVPFTVDGETSYYTWSCEQDSGSIVGGGVQRLISNCYIFNASEENTWIEWDVKTRINQYWRSTADGYGQNAQPEFTSSTTWTASILWQDIAENAASSITLTKNLTNDGVTLALSNTALRGNVVVAVKNGDEDILWSWHIWITDYNPDAIAKANGKPTSTNSKFTSSDSTGELHRYSSDMWTTGELAGKYIMDRNIGSKDTTSYYGEGVLYYQFGRKDPFPAATTTSGTESAAWRNGSTWTITDVPYDSSSNSAITMATAIMDPMMFQRRSSTTGNWCSEATTATYAWNDIAQNNLTGKSIFDPSPAGWKVPATGVWSAATSSTTFPVPTYFTNASYPACGSRYYTTAAMSNVGTYGRYWSSTPNSETNGYNFNFNSGNVNPANNNNRSNGYSVRAVQEIINT